MFLLHESRKDWYLVALVLILSVGANLPDKFTDQFYINRQFLIFGLVGLVAVSLVRYLKFALLLVVVILTIGANLPQQFANELGIDKTILLLGLVFMVAISFANRYLKLETGLNKKVGNASLHGATALFKAISYGRVAAVENLLQSGVNVNVRTVSGITPLIMATTKGYGDIVKILLDHGARVSTVGRDGKTAADFAEELGYTRILELFEGARMRTSQSTSELATESV